MSDFRSRESGRLQIGPCEINLQIKRALPNVIRRQGDFSFPEKECAQPIYEYIVAMPTYIYETTDPAKPVRTFEVKQSVHDEPLRSDPETGEGARRVISAGYSVLVRGKSVGPSVGSVGSH